MKNFIFSFLIAALVLCAGLSVSFGSHEIKKPVKLYKELKTESIYTLNVIGSHDAGAGGYLLDVEYTSFHYGLELKSYFLTLYKPKGYIDSKGFRSYDLIYNCRSNC